MKTSMTGRIMPLAEIVPYALEEIGEYPESISDTEGK